MHAVTLFGAMQSTAEYAHAALLPASALLRRLCAIGQLMHVSRGIAVLTNASMALALSAHTPRVQLSVYDVSATGDAELGEGTPSGT